MPAFKTDHYPSATKSIANTAKALAHPARVRIVQLLRDYPGCRNIDLVKQLSLSKATVHDHLQFLRRADLVYFYHHQNSFSVYLNEQHFDQLLFFLTESQDNC